MVSQYLTACTAVFHVCYGALCQPAVGASRRAIHISVLARAGVQQVCTVQVLQRQFVGAMVSSLYWAAVLYNAGDVLPRSFTSFMSVLLAPACNQGGVLVNLVL